MKLWIARDKNKSLWLYYYKPKRYVDAFDTETGIEPKMWLDGDVFPEVTFENSPLEVELNLKINNHANNKQRDLG